MKYFTHELATVTAAAGGNGIENGIRLDGDLGAKVAQLRAHLLGCLVRARADHCDIRETRKVVYFPPRQTVGHQPRGEVPTGKPLAVDVCVGGTLCDAVPLTKLVHPQVADVFGKLHVPIIDSNGVDTQVALRRKSGDLMLQCVPLHNLRMADKHSDTTIVRAVRRAAGGARVKVAREKANISRPALAKQLDVPYTTLASIEQGQRGVTFDMAVKLSGIFDVAGEWFMGSMDRQEALLIGTSRGLRGFIHEPERSHRPVGAAPDKPYTRSRRARPQE